MTYFTPIEISGKEPMERSANSMRSPEQANFTPLEWSIVRLARNEKLWTIGTNSPVQRLLNFLLGRKAYRLANDRLEALRRIAVQSWHLGVSVAADKVTAFLDAGFSADHYQLLVSSIQRSSEPSAIGGSVLI